MTAPHPPPGTHLVPANRDRVQLVQLSPRSSYSHISITVLSYLRNHEFCLSRIAILGLGPVCDLDGSTCRPPTSENDVPEEEDDGVSFRQLHVSCAILSQLYADGLHLRSIHGHQTIIQNCPVGIFNLRDHSVSQAMARAVAAHWHLNHLTMHRIVIDNALFRATRPQEDPPLLESELAVRDQWFKVSRYPNRDCLLILAWYLDLAAVYQILLENQGRMENLIFLGLGLPLISMKDHHGRHVLLQEKLRRSFGSLPELDYRWFPGHSKPLELVIYKEFQPNQYKWFGTREDRMREYHPACDANRISGDWHIYADPNYTKSSQHGTH